MDVPLIRKRSKRFFLENVREENQIFKNFINEIKCIMFTSPRTNAMAGQLEHTTRRLSKRGICKGNEKTSV